MVLSLILYIAILHMIIYSTELEHKRNNIKHGLN